MAEALRKQIVDVKKQIEEYKEKYEAEVKATKKLEVQYQKLRKKSAEFEGGQDPAAQKKKKKKEHKDSTAADGPTQKGEDSTEWKKKQAALAANKSPRTKLSAAREEPSQKEDDNNTDKDKNKDNEDKNKAKDKAKDNDNKDKDKAAKPHHKKKKPHNTNGADGDKQIKKKKKKKDPKATAPPEETPEPTPVSPVDSKTTPAPSPSTKDDKQPKGDKEADRGKDTKNEPATPNTDKKAASQEVPIPPKKLLPISKSGPVRRNPSADAAATPAAPASAKEKQQDPPKPKADTVLYCVRALEAHKSKQKTDLVFSKGATIQVYEENTDAGTMRGAIGKKMGWFPAYYVVKI